MRLVLIVFGILASQFAVADDFGIQNCSLVKLNFRDVKQMRDFDNGEVRMYLIDRTIDQITSNGVAVTFGDFCRYINGFFATDLNEARPVIDRSRNVDRVRLKLFVPEGEGARLAWMTVQIKKDAQSERSAISAWWR